MTDHEPPEGPDLDEAEYQRLRAITWQRDLRAVCIHEYAHLHVAQHHNVFGWVEIEPRAEGSSWFLEKLFLGRFRCHPIADRTVAQLVGLAGTCAEQIDKNPEVRAADIFEWLSPDVGAISLSETDSLMVGEFDEASVENCVSILQTLWTEIVRDAEDHVATEVERARADRG